MTNTINPAAEKKIKNHVLMSIGIAAIPVPMLDYIMVYYIQMDMIKQLSRIYHKPYYEMKGKAYIGALVSTSLARMGASLIKGLPGVGSLMGTVSSVVLSGASTYAVGRVTARFLQDNIELSDVDMDLAKSMFKEEFEKGKTVAKKLVEEKEAKKKQMSPDEVARQEAKEKDIYNQLARIKTLRAKNIITFEEYESLRLKYMKQLDL